MSFHICFFFFEGICLLFIDIIICLYLYTHRYASMLPNRKTVLPWLSLSFFALNEKNMCL